MSFAGDALPSGFTEEDVRRAMAVAAATASPSTASQARGFPSVLGGMAFVSTTGAQAPPDGDSGTDTHRSSPASCASENVAAPGNLFTTAHVLSLAEETKSQLPVSERPQNHSSVQWDVREPIDSDSQTRINFLGLVTLTPHVFMRLDFALRQTFIGVLPSALLFLNDNAAKTWVSRLGDMILINCIVAMQPRLGFTVEHVILLWAACIVYVPVSAIAIAIDPARNEYAWYAVYAALVFLIATFTKGLVTKMTLFFFTVTYVLHKENKLTLHGKTQNPEFPLHFIVPCVLGTGFALAASLVPYPRTYRQTCEARLETVFSSIAICFEGCCRSVWAPDPLERRVNRAKLRSTRRAVHYSVVELKKCVEMMTLEPWSPAVLARAGARAELAEKLLVSIDGMLLYIEGLASAGAPIDSSDAALRWGTAFMGPMLTGCQFVDELLLTVPRLSEPISQQQLDRIAVAQRVVLQGYYAARKAAMASENWATATTSAEVNFPFVSLGFFLFNFGQVFATLQHHREDSADIEHPVRRMVMWPIRGLLGALLDVRDLVQLKRPMLLRAREALKVTFAMWFAMLLLLYVGAPDPASGASVIGFIKDADPTSTVMASTEFVLGAVIGSIFGYLTASVSENLTDVCIWMCVLAFVTGFVKSGSRYGSTGFLTQFFALTTLGAVKVSQAATLIKIQQNVAAMLWLSITHLVLFPIWPSNQLQDEVTRALEKAKSLLMDLCVALETADSSAGERLFKLRSDLVASSSRARDLLPHAMVQPDVKKLPFPEHQTRNLLHAIDAISALVGPAIAAVQHEAQYHKSTSDIVDGDMAASSEPIELTKATAGSTDADESLPALVFQELRKCMPVMSLVIDDFMRAMIPDGDVSAEARVVDSATSHLIHLHSRVEVASTRLVTTAHAAFFQHAHTAKPSAYRMPALHVSVHFFHLLPTCLHGLLSATIEYDKARIIRG